MYIYTFSEKIKIGLIKIMLYISSIKNTHFGKSFGTNLFYYFFING